VTLEELLAGIARDDTPLAERLEGLEAEQAQALLDEADAKFTEIAEADGDRTDDEIDQMRQLVDIVEASRSRVDAISQAETDRRATVAELHGRLRPKETEEPEGESEDDESDAEREEQPQNEAVAAGNRRRTPLSALRSDDRKKIRKNDTSWSLTAAADIPGYNTGQEIDFNQLVDAATKRLQGLSRIGQTGQGVNIAQLSLTREESLIARDEGDHRVVDYAADERRLPGGSLVAAAATAPIAQNDLWCSPSETIYDFCPDLSSRDGILDVPTITVRHGGVRWPVTPSYSDFYKQVSSTSEPMTWDWTERIISKEEARPASKPCAEIKCPEWHEMRLNLRGFCLKADILTNHSWPELMREWTQRLLKGHDHMINAANLAKMEALCKAQGEVDYVRTVPADQFKDLTKSIVPTTGGYGPGATAGLLGVLEYQVEDIRYRWRMARGATLEVVLPYWIRGLLRSDLAKRQGVDLLSVPDARIDAFFRDRGVRVQYVYDWQNLGEGAVGSVKGWPTNLRVMIYTAGAFVSARQDVISMDGLYDSTNLAQNKFISMFTEEAYALGKRCGEARLLTVDLCADGATTGGANPNFDLTCPAA
jgi:hypothetical protein